MGLRLICFDIDEMGVGEILGNGDGKGAAADANVRKRTCRFRLPISL